MNLQEFIEQNRNFFDNEEPSENHFSRFEKRLQNKKRVSFFESNFFLKLAATIILLLSLGIFTYKILIFKEISEVNEIIAEYSEAEMYYQQNLNSKWSEFQKLQCQNLSADKEKVKKELFVLNKEYEILQKELLQTPNNQEVIGAMVKNYKLRIELIDNFIQQIKRHC